MYKLQVKFIIHLFLTVSASFNNYLKEWKDVAKKWDVGHGDFWDAALLDEDKSPSAILEWAEVEGEGTSLPWASPEFKNFIFQWVIQDVAWT